MGKVKSAICLTLITILLAVLCVTCFVPFPVGGDGIQYFNPIINWTAKSADFGGYQYGGSNPSYLGGAYFAVLYPEGVISGQEYADNLSAKTGEERDEYEESYVPYLNGTLYLEKETVCGGGTEATEEFKANFETQVELLKARYEALYQENTALAVRDDFTVEVTLPATMQAAIAAFVYFSYTDKLTVKYGSDAASATVVFPETGKKAKPITDYLKGVSTRTNGGVVYVGLNMTALGQELIANVTADASSSSSTLYFMLGDDTIINLSVDTQIDQRDLYISGSYTEETAAVVATVLDTAVDFGGTDGLSAMKMGEFRLTKAAFGNDALTFVYIAVGVCLVLMAGYFLIRYRRLGFAHIYSYLIFFLAMILCVWSIGTLSIGVGTLSALLLTSLLLCASNAISYEYARKEFATGKTMASSVKTGYKKCFWHIFDLHIALLIIGLLVYLISVTELSAFALAFTLGTLFSGICTLAINRFMWYIMMPFAKTPAKFCHFKRVEVEDDE